MRAWWWLVLVAGSLSGLAQADEPQQLEEVVVTATRAPLPKQKLTKSVSAVTGETIAEHYDETVQDTLRTIPGVHVRRSGATGRITSAVIRGSSDDQVLVLVDGVEVASPTLGSFDWATFPADFVERVEVLRGSASTLYDSKAIGGVINVRTKRGEGPPSLTYHQEFGTLRTFRETISAQGEVAPLKYHLGASRVDSNGLSEHDDVELNAVSASGVWQIAERLQLDTALNAQHSYVGIDDGAFLPDPNRFIERDHLVFSTTMKAQPLDRWEQELRFGVNDDDVLDVDLANPGTTQSSTNSRINTTRFMADWLHRFMLGPFGLTTAGVEFRDDEAESTRFQKTILTWATFVQHQLEFFDRLTLLGGVRHGRHNFFGHETTSEASASYRIPVIETRLRAGYSEGFRAPDLNELFFPNFGNDQLQPEESQSYEVGLSRDWWDGKASLDVAWYHAEVEELIQAVRVSASASQAQNIGSAELEGFEVEATVHPLDTLHARLAWTYTDAEEDRTREELVRIPRYRVACDVVCQFHPRWRLQLGALLVGHQEEQVATNSRQRVEHYATVDASLTWQVTKHLELYGRVENLFDRRYSEVFGFPAPGTLFFIGGRLEI